MKRPRSIFMIGLTLLVGCASACQSVSPKRFHASRHEFMQRLEKLHQRIDAVSAALDQATGFNKQAGLIDLQVARLFADYVEWELDHPEIVKEVLVAGEIFQKNPNRDAAEQNRRYQQHIDRELTGSMALLDRTLLRLESTHQPALAPISWSRMTYEDGYFRVDGRPVFPAGFNMLARGLTDLSQHPQWTKKDEEQVGSLLEAMQPLGVGLIGTGLSVPGMIMDDGRIDTAKIRHHAQLIQRYERMGYKVDILLHWRGDKGALEELWPGITDTYGNGVYLDIDHPGTRELTSRVMTELIPALRDRPAILSWDLANEPFFDLEMWSGHSLRKYRAWLAEQYKTIDELNAVWKTDHPDFQSIPLPKDKPRIQCSAGEWYDRVTFHSERVRDFFAFVAGEIRKHKPDAFIHLKGQDNNSLGPLPDAVTDGIDREMLTALCDAHGVDTRPLPVTEPRMAAINRGGDLPAILNYDESLYGFHWLGQSFLYDYLSSLPSHRPIVDFEYHAFSINPIRVPDIPPSHPRAALWLAHLHGLIGNMAWYWHHRYGPYPFPGKYFKAWLYGSISTQPVIAAEYLQTMLQMNEFATEVEALAGRPDRPVRLFVSKPSYIQNQAHIHALHRAYEGACFHGLPVGFVTESMLANDGVPNDCRIIVIPDAQYVSPGALKVLKQGKQQGVQLVRFGKRKTTYDQHGLAHAPQSIDFLKDVPIYDYETAPELSRRFEELFQPLIEARPIRVNRTDKDGTFGIIHRQQQIGEHQIVLMVNVSNEPLRAEMQYRDGRPLTGYDLLNRQTLRGTNIPMPLQAVRLIKTSPDEGSSTDVPEPERPQNR